MHDQHSVHVYMQVLFSGPEPPSDVKAVQDGPTSITVIWTASSDGTGYRISYNSSGGDSGSVDVSGNNHTLTDLEMEATYTISIIATSQAISSSPVTTEATLSEKNFKLWANL